jgi:small-conductance mechanosensitive channel
VLAVALTAFMLLFFNDLPAQAVEAESAAAETGEVIEARTSGDATEQAVGSLRATWNAFSVTWPKIAIGIGILALGWAVSRLVRASVHRVTRRWQRSQAVAALAGIAIWLLAIALTASVIAGDLRALIGSLGLIGLALSWALQTPIESFTGWLLNSFQGYYRVGDRVVVGDAFGDVVKIDFLTTTVWEIGTPQRPGFVNAEQPTGRVVTFPNSEVLTGTIVNLTRDFPYVWDELPVPVANESDLRLAMTVLERTANELLGALMVQPAEHYASILHQAGLTEPIATRPQVFAASTESWTDISIRYLVPARERRKWKSELLVRTTEAMAEPAVAKRVYPAYPRRQVQALSPDGRAVEWPPAPTEPPASPRS